MISPAILWAIIIILFIPYLLVGLVLSYIKCRQSSQSLPEQKAQSDQDNNFLEFFKN